MLTLKLTVGLATGLWTCMVQALPYDHSDSLVNAAIDNGTFKDPSVFVRPRYRYWVPDASVDAAVLREDIAGAKTSGAGGVEVLGYYLYGGTPEGTGNFAPDDWSIYGWGTPAWTDVFHTLAQAHKDNGCIMDFAMGPNQGQGVPAPENSEGLMYDLYAFNFTVPLGGSWSGKLPGWDSVEGTVKLQAVITGLVTNSVNVTVPSTSMTSLNTTGTYPSLPGDGPFDRTQVTLATGSLQDLTSHVRSDGNLHVSFPHNSTGLYHEVFVIYQIHNGYRAQQNPAFMRGPQTTPKTWQQNGSWAVDHFSALGAKTMTDYWEKYIVPEESELKKLLQEVGNYGWEDSIETRANVFFTENYTTSFMGDHGYDISKYLPILFHQNKIGFDTEPTVWYITDEPDAGDSHIADYRQTLTNLYGIYVSTLEAWAEDYLNLQFSAQISYNLPMEMLQNVPLVGGTECESLGFNHLIDGYRQYTGPANLAQKRLVSTEEGAIHEEAYQQTIPEWLWDAKRTIAGSVTQFIIHGYPYSGEYGNTTWPGWSTFDYAYSEMHGPRQPAWEFYKDTFLDFLARHSFIFQSGIPKRDVAFYMYITTFPGIVRNYMPTDLEEAGYTYEYLSPNNFDLPQAYVKNGVLGPDAQEFKALVVRGNDSMTVAGAEGIARFAHAGLPIIFSGGIPTYLASYNQSGSEYAKKTLHSLTSLPNVHQVPYEGLANTLDSLGITPGTKVVADNTWYTYWRQTDDFNYFFVYNDALAPSTWGLGNGYSEGSVQFASLGTPYILDAWTGDQIPILNYTQSANSTKIPFQLAGNQSVIVAFDLSSSDEDTHGSASGQTYNVQDLSQYYPPKSSSDPIEINNWTVTIEHWDPPSDLYKMLPSDTVKYNTTHSLPNGLKSWKDLDSNLTTTSGRGYYTSIFSWPSSDHSKSAIIDFGAIFHTLRVTVNGHTLPPMDPTWARADITKYLRPGKNRVDALVTTPLLNTMRPLWSELESGANGTATPISGQPPQDYGLLSSVKVIPY
ncbi:hypothetical protein N7474_005637 [Penicillium riverlandense]|uniref:uncharacterized protein n=1 Tax=Penicillium riverlandense TaxID=1903569 RepID=UPI002548CB08|nr:uncharacterized protein N7474_005637 [Penicillium riverlandense]KAJ5820046.1 hypothetical protein N7474_005637 [Penicillium riverlandense]